MLNFKTAFFWLWYHIYTIFTSSIFFIMKPSGWALLLTISIFTTSVIPQNIDSLKLELENASGKQKLNILGKLSNHYARTNPALSLSYDSLALQLAGEMGNLTGMSHTLNNMGLSFYALSDYVNAIDFISRSLTLKEKIGDSIEIVKTLNNLGALYQVIGDFESSIELLNRSLTIRRHRSDTAGIARTLNNISVIYMKAGQTALSLSMLNEALEIYEATNNNEGIASVYNNKGTVYQELKNNEEAARYFLMSLELKDEKEDPRGVANTLNNLGMVTQEAGNFEDAKTYYLKALNIRTEINDIYGLVTVKINLGSLYRLKSQFNESEKYLLEAQRIAEEENFREYLQRCYNELSLLYADLKNFKAAFNYSAKALSYKDTVYSDELNKSIADLENQQKTRIAYREKEILRIDNELKSVMIKRKNFNQWLSVGLAVLALVFVYINWKRLKDKQRLNRSLSETIDKLTVSEENLRQANMTKDKLFSIIGHDLRNPFGNILGFSEMMKTEASNLTKSEVEDYATYIHISASQAILLLENLLQWAKLQREQVAFTPKELVLKKLVKHNTSFLYYSALRKNILLDARIPDDLRVFADEEMLSTIIRNLISNAIKFTGSGGAVVVSAGLSGNNLQILVADNGIGISPSELTLIFDGKSHYSKQGTDNEKGTGLGLVLCKEFVERHQGRIWVESEVGKGSAFYFTLPYNIKNENNR